MVVIGEECDDGNHMDMDCCNHLCQLECGFYWEDKSCKTYCGDGTIAGDEECDGGEDCTSQCTLKPVIDCVENPDICNVCGNGIIENEEVCDNGFLIGPKSNGCTDYCEVIEGWTCTEEGLCTKGCPDDEAEPHSSLTEALSSLK